MCTRACAINIRLPSPRSLTSVIYINSKITAISVATAGFFPLDLGFFGVVWVSGYFCQ